MCSKGYWAMKKVFISGSISIKEIPQKVYPRLDNMIKNNLEILIGDAPGIDSAVQDYFKLKRYFNLCVYSIYDSARYKADGRFKFKKIDFPHKIEIEYEECGDKKEKKINKERDKQSFKDKAMANDCDYGLIIWDEKSNGCYQNIQNLSNLKKLYEVYDDNIQDFLDNEQKLAENVKICYEENNGLSADEICKRLDNSNLTNARSLNKFLCENGIIKKIDHSYKAQNGYEKYIKIKKYKGKETKQIKYAVELVRLISETYRRKNK